MRPGSQSTAIEEIERLEAFMREVGALTYKRMGWAPLYDLECLAEAFVEAYWKQPALECVCDDDIREAARLDVPHTYARRAFFEGYDAAKQEAA
jgi:hypothetical protein